MLLKRGRGLGAVPTPEPENNTAAAVAIDAIQRTADGPSVVLTSKRTPKHPDAAPSNFTPYTRPIGKGAAGQC
jgi:hypothetical protein